MTLLWDGGRRRKDASEMLRVRQRSKKWRPRYWKRTWSQAAHVHGAHDKDEDEEEEEEEEEVDCWREGEC
ncbi:hypothetical protein E2C01_085593 [Portunus trituberculatus]|uniref:Uncharacterized protein n=1 Tax=Portunus trituberculatus TaxID=210409 RepID=A0A5B7JCC8_PORTR|nr:hypothetical protein [Portunus trituberculatus]